LSIEWEAIFIENNISGNKIALVLRSRVIYPLVFGLKPRKIEVSALGSSFFPLEIRVLEKHKQPNTLKEAIS